MSEKENPNQGLPEDKKAQQQNQEKEQVEQQSAENLVEKPSEEIKEGNSQPKRETSDNEIVGEGISNAMTDEAENVGRQQNQAENSDSADENAQLEENRKSDRSTDATSEVTEKPIEAIDSVEDTKDTKPQEPQSSRAAHEEMEEANAEESEDESTSEKHGIPKKDYHSMNQEELVDELERLLSSHKVQAIKEHVDEIKAEFNAKFDEELEDKKEEFLADGGNIIDFHYSTPTKKRFNSLYFDYKERRNKYYQNLKQNLEENLKKRLDIIEDLKGLIDVEENINTTYNHFKELQDKWHSAGPIPRDQYSNVWNTYHHHVENFYDFLHLNREFRDMDFKHNLEQKLKIIDRAEELAQEEDVNKAFRELQMLHKMWKEDLGPVAKEYREDLWERFSDATKKIHEKRQEYFKQLDKQREENLERKREIISKLKEIAETKEQSHQQWQQKIKEVEDLRNKFFKAGKVPREVNEEVWDEFKKTVRQFNRNKNAYYKNLKKEQYENLEKKQELIKIAEDNKDNEDFKATTPLMKKIQNDWKKIGHVPRKDSDKIWKKFKAACNHYFDRLHAERNQENKEEIQAFEQKKELLDEVKTLELTGTHKEKLATIKSYIAKWKEIGPIPQKMRFIEGKFNKALDQLFGKLDVDKTEAEMLKYENKIQALNESDDTRKITNEHYFLTKKIEETEAEIRQLENNLQFFTNVDDNNPLVKEVHKNIEKHKDQLEIWKEKLRKVKTLY